MITSAIKHWCVHLFLPIPQKQVFTSLPQEIHTSLGTYSPEPLSPSKRMAPGSLLPLELRALVRGDRAVSFRQHFPLTSALMQSNAAEIPTVASCGGFVRRPVRLRQRRSPRPFLGGGRTLKRTRKGVKMWAALPQSFSGFRGRSFFLLVGRLEDRRKAVGGAGGRTLLPAPL